jgi:hypothetical protein
MDFSDFITLILFFVFIFAPLLKRSKKKTVRASDKSKKSGFSVLGKLNDVLKEAAREMQAQAEQSRKKETSGRPKVSRDLNESPFDQTGKDAVDQTFWDEIDDREEVDFYPENLDVQVKAPFEPVTEQPPLVSTQKESRRKAVRRRETRDAKCLMPDAVQTSCHRAGRRRLPARARGLRKAVIWSEILGKPVALRDSDLF